MSQVKRQQSEYDEPSHSQSTSISEQIKVDDEDKKFAQLALYKKVFANPIHCICVIPSFISGGGMIFIMFLFGKIINTMMEFYQNEDESKRIMDEIVDLICWQIFVAILLGAAKFLDDLS